MNLGRFINIWGRDYISRDFGGGPETKPDLRIFPLEIEFFSKTSNFSILPLNLPSKLHLIRMKIVDFN